MKLRLGLLTAIAILISLSGSRAQETDNPPLTGAQARELKIWVAQLTDSETSAKTKFDAAALLLDRPYPQAAQALLNLLTSKNDHDAKIAVAEAIAGAGGKSEFIEPLMAMMTGKDAAIRSAAAKALLTYKNHGVAERLIEVMRDPKREREVRLETMAVLQRVLDKRVVGALVALLSDADPAISKAALETLPKLTNIYGYGPEEWQKWWQKNKDRPLSEWLSQWAENLAKRSRELEETNAALRSRLGKAMEDLYAATPPDKREAMLMGLLQDPIAEVRLVGASLISASAAGGTKVPPVVVAEVRKLLDDEEIRVRKAAAVLAGGFADAQAVKPLLAQLEVETEADVRKAVLTSLGQLQDESATPAVLKNIASQENAVAAAAAVALERIATRSPLKGKAATSAGEVILGRYALATKSERTKDAVALLEALMRAMGTVRSPSFLPVIREALKDEAAMIRLASVNSLGELCDPACAPAVVPLVSDQDRGVRQAAIVVLGKLGGAKYIPSLVERARPSSEPDAAVRQQAKEVAFDLLKKADTQTLWNVAAQLASLPDGREMHIQVLEMLVDRLEAEKAKNLYAAHRQLGLALKQAGKVPDAATHLRRAFDLLVKDKDAQAPAAWFEWLDVLYDQDADAVAKAIVEQEDEAMFTRAYAELGARMDKLKAAGEWPKLVALADASVKRLSPRLTAEQVAAMKKALGEAKAERRAAQEKLVHKLTGELLSPDEAVRLRAAAALKSMGDEAVRPLLEELKKAVTAEPPDPATEKAVLAVLAGVAPKLGGYNPAAPRADRTALIDKWTQGTQ